MPGHCRRTRSVATRTVLRAGGKVALAAMFCLPEPFGLLREFFPAKVLQNIECDFRREVRPHFKEAFRNVPLDARHN